ncbi:MAG TPA: hypothetical protein VNX68_02225 [Nitrosopumilaceae archaeon]|jgi:hypothetical protein|nr:hypothetical protein [Nitrosopumilaceae archaeon]
MKQKLKEKAVIARVPYDLWKYIKMTAVHDDKSVSSIINDCLIRFKNKREKKLTNVDNLIE